METPEGMSIEEQVLLLAKKENNKIIKKNVEKIVDHLNKLFVLNKKLEKLVFNITHDSVSVSSFFYFLRYYKSPPSIKMNPNSFIPMKSFTFDKKYLSYYNYISKSLIEIEANKKEYYDSIIDRHNYNGTLYSLDPENTLKSGLHEVKDHSFRKYDFVHYIQLLLEKLIRFVDDLQNHDGFKLFLDSINKKKSEIEELISSPCKKWCKTKRISFNGDRCISSRCHDLSSFLSNFKRIVTREKNLMLRNAVIEDRFNPGNKEEIIEEMCKSKTRKTFLNRTGITNDSTASLIIEVYDEVCQNKSCSLTNCFAKLLNLEKLIDDIYFLEKYILIIIKNIKYKKLYNLLFFKNWMGGSVKSRRRKRNFTR